MQHFRDDPDFYGALAIVRDHLRDNVTSSNDIVNHLIQNGHLRSFEGGHDSSRIHESAKQAVEYTDEEFNLHDPVNVQRILDVLVSLPSGTTEFLKLFLNSVIQKLPKDTDFYGALTVILEHLGRESPSSEAILNELIAKEHIRPAEGNGYQMSKGDVSTTLDEGNGSQVPEIDPSHITDESLQENLEALRDSNEILVPRGD